MSGQIDRFVTVLAVVEFTNGQTDYLSLEGLAFYRDKGRVRSASVVVVDSLAVGAMNPLRDLHPMTVVRES